MNEWQLQHYLTQTWGAGETVDYQNENYTMLCWELMFPSWGINDNRKKWNEPSIDFILFNNKDTFLCLELKNIIKGNCALLSAFCQVTHRTIEFIKGYQPNKLKKAISQCANEAAPERGKPQIIKSMSISFPENPKVKRVIAAVKFPNNSSEQLKTWSSLSKREIDEAVSVYSESKEFNRFRSILEEDFTSRDMGTITPLEIVPS